MRKSDRKVPQRVTIHPVFEPSRLARACLEEAYAHVVPKVRRPSQAVPPVQPATDAPALSQQGGTTP